MAEPSRGLMSDLKTSPGFAYQGGGSICQFMVYSFFLLLLLIHTRFIAGLHMYVIARYEKTDGGILLGSR